jgi:hypothetical protein
MFPIHISKESAMKTHKILIIAMILLLVIGSVPSLLARSSPPVDRATWPDDGSGEGNNILEGDPWDDNNDNGVDGSMVNLTATGSIRIVQWSVFRFWFISFDKVPDKTAHVVKAVGVKKSHSNLSK